MTNTQKPVAWLVAGADIDDIVYVDFNQAADAYNDDRPDGVSDDDWHRTITPLVPESPPPLSAISVEAGIMALLEKSMQAVVDDPAVVQEGGIVGPGMFGPLSAYLYIKSCLRTEAREAAKEERSKADADAMMKFFADKVCILSPPKKTAAPTPAKAKKTAGKKRSR